MSEEQKAGGGEWTALREWLREKSDGWLQACDKIMAGKGAAKPDAEDLSYADALRHCAAEVREIFAALAAPGEPPTEKLVAGPLRGARDLLERVKDIHPCGTCGHKRSDHAMDLEGDHFCEWNDLANGCHCRNYVGVFAPSYDELVAALASLPSSPPAAQYDLAKEIAADLEDAGLVNPGRDGIQAMEVIKKRLALASPVQGVQAQPFAYVCPANCGCMWRDNQDGTMSLFGKRSQSCEVCEALPLSVLTPVYIAVGQRAEGAKAGAPFIPMQHPAGEPYIMLGRAKDLLDRAKEAMECDPQADTVGEDCWIWIKQTEMWLQEVAALAAPPVAEKTELDQRSCDASHVETEEGAGSATRYLANPSSVQDKLSDVGEPRTLAKLLGRIERLLDSFQTGAHLYHSDAKQVVAVIQPPVKEMRDVIEATAAREVGEGLREREIDIEQAAIANCLEIVRNFYRSQTAQRIHAAIVNMANAKLKAKRLAAPAPKPAPGGERGK